MTEETVKENMNFGPSSSIDESAEKVRTQESSNIEDNLQVTLSGTGRSIEAGSTDNFENIYVSGTVGIGVASPFEKLEVSGMIKAIAFIGDGSEITALDGKKITSGIIEDSRIPSTISRENRFDPTNGHKHTGTAGDGPIISHSKLDEVLPANPDSIDTATNKHISDALAKDWQDHVMTKSGNPHGTTSRDIGALPITGGTINGTLQVNGNIETTGTVDGADIFNCFDPSRGHKHTGAAGDGPIIQHSNLGNILIANTSVASTDTMGKHVTDVLAKGWQDHVTTTSGNPHGTTATNVGALPISGGTINGPLQVNGEIGITGNIGIGTTVPRARLHAEATDKPTIMAQSEYGGLVSGSNGGHGVFGTNIYMDSNNNLKTAGKHDANYGYAGMHATWGNIHFYAANGNTIEKGIINPPSRLFIRGSDGYVGIGTLDPKDKLDVNGSIRLSGKLAFQGHDDFLRINQNNEFPKGTHFNRRVNFRSGITTGTWWDIEPGEGNILIQGNVGIGTTVPRARLHAEATDKPTIMAQSEYGGLVSGSNGGHGVFGTNIYIDSNNQLKTAGKHDANYGYAGMDATWGNIHFYAADGNTTENGRISPSPRLVISPYEIKHFVKCSQASSRELKKDIRDLSIKEASKVLESLNPVTFVMKNDKEETLQVGFIAEEAPDLAATADRKGIVNNNIVAVLTKVIKEQQKEIKALIDDVKTLKINSGGIIS